MIRSKRQKKQREGRSRRTRSLLTGALPQRSQSARDRALHVIAAMRREPSLSLTQAAKLHGVKRETVRKYFSGVFKKVGGHFKAAQADRYAQTLYLFDPQGNKVPIKTRSSKDRKAASRYLRDVGRYLRGQRDALAKWHGKRIAGLELVTAGRTLVSLEPLLSEFSLYRAFNGGAE